MYRIITAFLLLAMMACGQADKVPEGVLPKEKMRDILLDMNMADAYSSDGGDARIPQPDSVRQQRLKTYYRQILELHGLSREEFMKSYSFYESRPDRMKEVYEMMMTTVGEERKVLDIAASRKEYASKPLSLLPFGKNALISTTRDTIIPFVKRAKK